MGRKSLSERDNWQGKSAARGHGAEDVFHTIMKMHLEHTDFLTVHKPKDLKGIYGERKDKRGRVSPHGIHPEYAITSKTSGRSIYVEIKRQRAQGNAHERACKYFTPGILNSLRQHANQPAEIIPFWWIFTDGIANDKYYRQEIMHWFRGIEAHVLLWKNVHDVDVVRNHFDQHIRQLLNN